MYKYIKNFAFPFPTAILVFIDQAVKMVIRTFFFDQEFTIIPGIFRFYPVVNTKLSWGAHYIDILGNPVIVYTFNIILILFIGTGYNFYCSIAKRKNRWDISLFIAGMAGSVCSLVDKVFHEGSLDFIEIPHLFVFDLKDCYLTYAVILMIILYIKYHEILQNISIRDYRTYCFQWMRKTKVADK